MEYKTIHFKGSDGRPTAGAAVYVYSPGTETQASIFDESGAALSQPLTTDASGNASFAARNGSYDVAGTYNGQTVTAENERFYDPADENYSTRAALVTAVSAGYTWPDGAVVSDGTVSYIASSGATDISDLAGLLPHDPSGEYDAFVEHFVTTSPSSAVNITTALQAAVDYVGAIGSGTFGQGGKIGLKAREYTIADADADNYGVEIANSMTIEGAGSNSTTIYINTTNETMFYVGKGDAAILADTAGTAVVDKVFFRGIQFYNTTSASAPPTAGSFIEADRAVVECHECRFVNHFRAVQYLGNPESVRLVNCDITAGSNVYPTLAYDAQSGNFTAGLTITGGTSGATAVIESDTDAGSTGTLTLSSVTGLFKDNETITDTSTGSATVNGILTGKSGSCGVFIGRRQVNASLPGAYQDSGDSLYYIEPNTVSLPGCNIRMGATASQYGGAFAVRAGAFDLVDISGAHLAWGYTACLGIIPEQSNMSMTDLNVSGGLIDPLPNKTRYGIYVADVSGVGSTTIGSIKVSDLSISGAELDALRIVVDCKRVKFSNVEFKSCGEYGAIVNDANAESVTFTGCDFFNTNTNGGTNAALYIGAGDRIKVTGCNFDTGYRGIQIAGSPTRITITDNTFDGMSTGQSIFLRAGYTGKVTISGNDIDESTTIASATTIALPVGADKFYITGTKTITTIRATSPISEYDGREVTLVFAGALTMNETGNLDLGGNITTAATDVVRLVWDATTAKWLLISHSVN